MPRSLPAEVFQAFRYPTADPQFPRERLSLHLQQRGAEAEHIAEILRSAHLRDNLAWTDMAVLVRAGRTMIPGLTRALVAAGVPVEVAGDEIPLAADPRCVHCCWLFRSPLEAARPPARRHSCCSPHRSVAWTACPLAVWDAPSVRPSVPSWPARRCHGPRSS